MVELPDTFAPLGTVAADIVAGLAARRAAAAHPDAAAIDLAGRVTALAERNYAHQGRIQRIRDRLSAEHPSTVERTGRTATREEFEAHQAVVRPIEGSLGPPRLQKVGRRMLDRLIRWTRQLATTEPASMAA